MVKNEVDVDLYIKQLANDTLSFTLTNNTCKDILLLYKEKARRD